MAKKDAFIEFFEKYTNYQSIHVKLFYKKNGQKWIKSTNKTSLHQDNLKPK